MVCGVYQIKNGRNSKRYIGSSKCVEERLEVHSWKLRSDKSKHPNPHLQKAWNKYGERAFKLTLVEECGEDIRYEKEQKYLNTYISANIWNQLYNISQEARGGPIRDEPRSKGCKKAISKANSGTGNGRSKFSEDEIEEIRGKYWEGRLTLKEISDEFNTGQTTIHNVVNGNTYKNCSGRVEGEKPKISGSNYSNLTKEQVVEIRERYRDEDTSFSELAKDYPVKKACLSHITSGRNWESAGGPINGEDYDKNRKEKTYLNEKGEEHLRSELKEKNVMKIRRRYKQENTSLAELAEDYPVSKHGIYDVVRGRSWTHVEGPIKGEDY